MARESNIQRAVMLAASAAGMTTWRNHTGLAWTGDVDWKAASLNWKNAINPTLEALMSKPIERRIEALEQSAPDQFRPDFSCLTREERAEVREVLLAVGDGRMSSADAEAWLAQTPILARHRS